MKLCLIFVVVLSSLLITITGAKMPKFSKKQQPSNNNNTKRNFNIQINNSRNYNRNRRVGSDVSKSNSRSFKLKYRESNSPYGHWETVCQVEKPDEVPQNTTTSLWKDDMYSLRACDVLEEDERPGDNGETVLMPIEISNTNFQFKTKQATGKKLPDSSYCVVDNGQDGNQQLCLNGDFNSDVTLPFCSHLEIWQVLQSTPEIAAKCSKLGNDSEENSARQCQTCATELLRLDKLARLGYCGLESVLSRADCKDPYSPTKANCQNCKESYRNWLCSQFFVKILVDDVHSTETAIIGDLNAVTTTLKINSARRFVKPCTSVCNEVMKMCPYFSPIWDEEPQRQPMDYSDPVEYSGWSA